MIFFIYLYCICFQLWKWRDIDWKTFKPVCMCIHPSNIWIKEKYICLLAFFIKHNVSIQFSYSIVCENTKHIHIKFSFVFMCKWAVWEILIQRATYRWNKVSFSASWGFKNVWDSVLELLMYLSSAPKPSLFALLSLFTLQLTLTSTFTCLFLLKRTFFTAYSYFRY